MLKNDLVTVIHKTLLLFSNVGQGSLENVNASTKAELRWRSDESSEEEEAKTPLRITSTRRARRSRFARV